MSGDSPNIFVKRQFNDVFLFRNGLLKSRHLHGEKSSQKVFLFHLALLVEAVAVRKVYLYRWVVWFL